MQPNTTKSIYRIVANSIQLQIYNQLPMLKSDEQFQIALEVMQRLQSEYPIESLPLRPAESVDTDLPLSTGTLKTASWQCPSLTELIRNIGPQPAYSALIGLCEDGLPFMFDLSDPAPGSILIAGDRKSGKTRLLQSVLSSIGALNGSDEVCYYLITPRPVENQIIYRQAHCLDILSPDEQSASALVLDFAEIANQRRSGRELGPITILAIDDLAALDYYLDDKITRYLQWLLEYGPKVGVWVIGTVDAEGARRIDRRLIPAFGTRLIGQTTSRSLAGLLSGYADPVVETLESGKQFCILYGSEWLRFWIPSIGE
jgi:hypothetical protein